MRKHPGSAAPLRDVRVLELGGVGPCPFAGMMLADMGAEVVRIDGPASWPSGEPDSGDKSILRRGKRSLAVDLSRPEARALVLGLVAGVDVLIEGFRPGVAERLGLGPAECHSLNPRLVYGRITGWGQEGPYSQLGGHDINYLGVSGVLATLGPAGREPSPPLNYIANYGGGGMFLLYGVLCALHEAGRSGLGQTVDAAMIDGAALLAAANLQLRADGRLNGARGSNVIDGGAPFYNTYQCADDRFLCVGAIEPQFYDEFLQRLRLDPSDWAEQYNQAAWPDRIAYLRRLFLLRTRDEWMELFRGFDLCVSPVLTFDEAALDEHNVARSTYVQWWDVLQPAPGPRLSRTPALQPSRPPAVGEHTELLVRELGLGQADYERLRRSGVVL